MDLSTILGGNRSGGRAHPFLEGGKFHHKGGVFGPPFLVELHTIYRNSVPRSGVVENVGLAFEVSFVAVIQAYIFLH